MQTKLHLWAVNDEHRCFDDLFNLVYDPAFLAVAWDQVSHNKGARTAGSRWTLIPLYRQSGCVSGRATRGSQEPPVHTKTGSTEIDSESQAESSGQLGFPTVEDRVVQASLKLVVEPIFEANFKPCSYGFRPMRRAQDAIAEIHFLGSGVRNYEHVFEGDIEACFDNIDHVALMGRIRRRVGDKRILALIKAFLRAGILSEEGLDRRTITGTPQGGVLSPLLANIALSVLDEHFTRKWEELGSVGIRARSSTSRDAGLPTHPLRG